MAKKSQNTAPAVSNGAVSPAPAGSVNVLVPGMSRIEVTVARKPVGTLDVRVSDMPAVSHAFIFDYGLRQILNDAKAGETEAGPAMGNVQKRLDRLMAGTIGSRERSAGPAPTNPVEAEAFRIAGERIKVRLREKGITLKALSDQAGKDAFGKMVAQLVERDPRIMEEAQRRVDANTGLDLDDIIGDIQVAPTGDADESADGDDDTAGDDETPADDETPTDDTGDQPAA